MFCFVCHNLLARCHAQCTASVAPPLLSASSCFHIPVVAAPSSVHTDIGGCCGTADGRGGPALLAACAARHWLARNAATVTRFCRSHTETAALACTSLVSCLPALELAELGFPRSLNSNDLGCLLAGLAWCPRLESLSLIIPHVDGNNNNARRPLPSTAAFTKLRSLKTLAQLSLDIYTFASVMDAVVFLTGLTELEVVARQPAVVPAALGLLKGLRALKLCSLKSCILEAGCLDLPNLVRLNFFGCCFEDASIVPGITALQGLTHIEFSGGQGPPFFPQLLQLPRLQHLVSTTLKPCHCGPELEQANPPADMCSLGLLHLDFSGHGHGLAHFPLALTQLVALECLNACGNDFAELSAGITALSRLTALSFGRAYSHEDPLQLHERISLDARALGDLSSFPSLCELTFDYCEVIVCESMLGATGHASLTSLEFCLAYPAPESAMVILQLSQALRKLGRGNLLKLVDNSGLEHDLADSAVSPFCMFEVALKVCGL